MILIRSIMKVALVLGFAALSLVQADDNGAVNLALTGTASQSNTHSEGDKAKAANANDGNMETKTHTASELNNWWEVALVDGTPQDISQVKIYPSDHCSQQCLNRFLGATVKIFNGSVLVWTSPAVSNSDLPITTFDFDTPKVGNRVRVDLASGFLHMKEVQVWGPVPSANAVGDPHFRTFGGIFFSYHGACDLLLMMSSIHDVMVQIRTTRVDTHGQSFSYISQAAVKIQEVILEVSADGTLLVDGEDSSDSIPSSIAGHSLTKTIKGTKRHIISYNLDLGNGRTINLRSNTKSDMVYVDIHGHFSDSKGLLGSPETEELYSRDGTAGGLEGSYNSYSEHWQVLSGEPMLFQEARFPQYPIGCSYMATKEEGVSSNLRRRLTDVVEQVSKDEAMKACADAAPGEKKDFCVTDVMLTGDLDLAEDEFYVTN